MPTMRCYDCGAEVVMDIPLDIVFCVPCGRKRSEADERRYEVKRRIDAETRLTNLLVLAVIPKMSTEEIEQLLDECDGGPLPDSEVQRLLAKFKEKP